MSTKVGGKSVGIDLGTTNSCVAVMQGGEPRVIENNEGARTTPSVVAFTDKDEMLVGAPAKRQATTNASNTLYSVKRLVGQKYDKIKDEPVAYKIVSANNGDAWVRANKKDYSPSQIGAYILQKMKKTAEDFLGEPVTKAVITVPAYFNDAQRQATKDAGAIAGLEVLRIINEPTAAALAYGLDKKHGEVIAIYDLGGGTFDVSVLEKGEGVFEVKATSGDTHLGGEDFDNRLLEHMLSVFGKDNPGIDLKKDCMAMQRVKEAAEKAKIELSSAMETEVNLPFISADSTGPKHLSIKITRSKFESLVEDLVKRTIEPCKKALETAGLSTGEVDSVILVGGMTRMPMVVAEVKRFFGKEPSRNVNPDEVVAMGAVIQAAIIEGDVRDVLLLDVVPISLGIETQGGVFTRLVNSNTTIPHKTSQIFSTAADGQQAVTIKVYQGERKMAQDNQLMATFDLTGIPHAPRGVPQIDVIFDIDANGITKVSACDKKTGAKRQVTIHASGGLTDDQIKKMRDEAQDKADEDEKRLEFVQAKNDAEGLIHSVRKTLSEQGSKIGESVKSEVEKAVQDLEESLSTDDLSMTSQIKEKVSKLQAASLKLGESVYSDSESGAEGSGASASSDQSSSSGSSSDEKVVDSEYREVDKDQ